jgi:hypothetical protein
MEVRVESAKSWMVCVNHRWKTIRRMEKGRKPPRAWENKAAWEDSGGLRWYKICSRAEANTLDRVETV